MASSSPLGGKRLLVLSEDPELGLLLAGTLRDLGGEAVRARSGAEAYQALAATRPHAAVLDLPVADAGAGLLLAELVRSAVPAVVVSGVYRGARATAELRRLGARDHLEKPFALSALLSAVANALGESPPPEVLAHDEVTGSLPLQPGGPPADPFLVPGARAAARRGATEGLALPLPDRGSARVTQPVATPAAQGDLAAATVPRLLVALHVGQATGALTLVRGAVKKIVIVESGAPVYAASNVAGERLGPLCVRRGLVSAERLEELRQAHPGRSTAELLREAGLLAPERRAELVTGQIRAIAWSTFSWRDGSYRFQAGRPPAARLPLRLDPGELILEGVRRASTLELLRAELPAEAHLAPRPDPAFELYALPIAPAEARLLTLADGTKRVADLLRLTELPEREALAFLQACRAMRILDEVGSVLASTRRTGFL